MEGVIKSGIVSAFVFVLFAPQMALLVTFLVVKLSDVIFAQDEEAVEECRKRKQKDKNEL